MKKAIIILIVILSLLVITNPSLTRFKEYNPLTALKGEKPVYRRVANYFIFSVYESKIEYYEYYDQLQSKNKSRYVGIILNFYQIK